MDLSTCIIWDGMTVRTISLITSSKNKKLITLKSFFIILIIGFASGCKSLPEQALPKNSILIDAPYEPKPDKVEYIVSLKGKWNHDLLLTESLPEAYEYFDNYKNSHGNMEITEVKYFDGKIVHSLVD